MVELNKDHTSSKYRNSRITDFFPKVEKSDVLIEDLQLRIKNLERERNHIEDQLNELKKWQSENGRGMCKVTPTQTKTSSLTPKQSSKKQNTEKGAQSENQVGRKKETTQSPEQKNPTNSCASDKSMQPTKHQQQQQLPKDKDHY